MKRCAFSLGRAALVVVLAIQVQAALATETNLFVDDGAAANGDGLSWSTAYRTLQDAISDAVGRTTGSGHETDTVTIKVAQGTYYPDRFNDATSGSNDRTKSFELHARVRIEGGYSGSGTTRDPSTYLTYLDGDIGTANSNTDNSYHVVRADAAGITATNCVVDGFTIRNGHANGPGRDQTYGAGIYIDSVSPKIYRCTITSNTAGGGGGIACVNNATPPEFWNCMIDHNIADDGGGLFANYTVRVIHSTFYANSATNGYGGGLMSAEIDSEHPLNVELLSCRFTANSSTNWGGGVFVSGHGQLTAINGLFASNHSQSNSGGIACVLANLKLVNCTLADNEAETAGGGLGIYSIATTTTQVSNCVFWSNSAGAAQDIYDVQNSLTNLVNYCDIEQSWSSGTGNFSSSPAFSDRNGTNNTLGDLDDDYRLTCGSPCINAGNDAHVPTDTYDINEANGTSEKTPDANLLPRLTGVDTDLNRVDIGAYELVPVNCAADVVPHSPCGDGLVNVDDLLAIITSWGTCASAVPGACPADIANADAEVNIDDLLLVITSWGACSALDSEGMPESIDDCMEMCSGMYEEYSDDWAACVNRCVSGLCAAHIIDCD